MYFDNDIELRFPRCVLYIKTVLQPKRLKTENAKTWNAFLRACKVEKWAITALTYASGPRVLVREGMVPLPNNGQACGRHVLIKAMGVNQVHLASKIMQAYEYGYTYPPDDLQNARQLEATLLHELVHWARDMAGLSSEHINDDSIDPDLFGEAGELFEFWAYNRRFCTVKDIEAGQSSIF
jgi:hypothetical protein